MAKPKRPKNAAELIHRAKQGDKAARDELLAYGDEYLRYKAKSPALRAPTRPSDVGGNSTVKMIESFKDFRGDTIELFEGWLHSIVSTHAFGLVRQGKRRKAKINIVASTNDSEAKDARDEQKSPSATMTVPEDWYTLYSAIALLPKDQGCAVHLKHIEGLSVAKVAKQMKKTPTQVGGLLQRGIDGVRKQLVAGTDDVPSKTTRAQREETIAALLKYTRSLDAGKNIDAEAFVAAHSPGNESLRKLIEWTHHIREIGGKPSNKGNK